MKAKNIRVDMFEYSLRKALGKPVLYPPIHPRESGGLNSQFVSGNLTLFAEYRSTMKPSGHMPSNFLETGNQYQGFSYTHSLPLEKGRIYKAEVVFDREAPTSPDMIAINNELYYRRRLSSKGKKLAFSYRAKKNGKAVFHFMQSHELRDRIGFSREDVSGRFLQMAMDFTVAFTPLPRGKVKPTTPIGRFGIPKGARTWKSPDVYKEANHYVPVKWKAKPLPKVDWPVEDLAIALHTESIRVADNNKRLQRKVLEFAADNHFTWANGAYFDINDRGIYPVLERFPYLPSGFHIRHTTGAGAKEKQAYPAETIKRINMLLRQFPKAKVLVWFSEPDTTQQWHVLRTKTARSLAEPGMNLRELRNVMAKAYRKEIMEHFGREVIDRKRVILLWQLAGMNGQGSDWYRFGIDLLHTKTIHRQCINIVAASGRGTAAPLGLPYAMEYDSWNGIYYHQNGDSEAEFYFASLYFAGASALSNELATVGICEKEGKIYPTACGVKLIELNRMMRTHPVRGSQLVQIAYMRGADDMWFRPTALGGNNHPLALPGDYEVDHQWKNADWGLLDVVFPKFGTAHQANFNRTGTGTPYGPADIISWDLPAKNMKRYGAVVIVGRNTIDAKILNEYVRYVRGGGTMVLAANGLKQTDGKTTKYLANVEKLIGVKLGKDVHIEPTRFDEIIPQQPKFYNEACVAVTKKTIKILERLPNGDPYLIERKLGKGKVYFFTTEDLTTIEGDTARSLLAGIFEKLAPVSLLPGSDWIEYALMAKRDSVSFAFINHGQAKYPSDKGTDTGPWKGTVSVCPSRLGLSGALEVYTISRDFKAKRLPVRKKGSVVSFSLKVDLWCEVVVGRKGKALKDFFRGKPRERQEPMVGGVSV